MIGSVSKDSGLFLCPDLTGDQFCLAIIGVEGSFRMYEMEA